MTTKLNREANSNALLGMGTASNLGSACQLAMRAPQLIDRGSVQGVQGDRGLKNRFREESPRLTKTLKTP